jgi:hypothetical protein
MAKWLVVLAVVLASVAFVSGQAVNHKHRPKHNSPAPAQAAPAPSSSEPTKPADSTVNADIPRGVSINKFPPVSVGRDWIDYVALILTVALVVLGSVGVWSANRTLRTIEKQVREMKRQTKLNREVAAATRINAEAVINSERSLLLVTHNAPAGSDTWIFKFEATNYGRSPAEILWIFFEPTPLGREETLPEWPIYETPEGHIFMHREWVPPGGSVPVGEGYYAEAVANMVPGLWEELRSGKRKLWLYGVVRYRDKVSSDIHETRFCYWKSPANGVNLIMGGPSRYNDVS